MRNGRVDHGLITIDHNRPESGITSTVPATTDLVLSRTDRHEATLPRMGGLASIPVPPPPYRLLGPMNRRSAADEALGSRPIDVVGIVSAIWSRVPGAAVAESLPAESAAGTMSAPGCHRRFDRQPTDPAWYCPATHHATGLRVGVGGGADEFARFAIRQGLAVSPGLGLDMCCSCRSVCSVDEGRPTDGRPHFRTDHIKYCQVT